MDLVYSMRRKPLKCAPPNFDEMTDPEAVHPICTISISNIIAFTSFTELSDVEGDTWAGHVYVCDLTTPWNSHKVTSTVHPVSTLEWDGEGKNLLVGTTVGDISVYGQKDYLLNEWTCLYSAKIPGEKVIKAIFFHNGRRVLPLDKKGEVPITERFQVLRNAPTLKGFGGVGCAGACALSGSGLLAALTPAPAPLAPPAALLAAEPLRPARDQLTAAAFAHKNGGLVVAACGARGGRRVVRVASVAVTRARPGEPVALRVTPLPALYLPDDPAHAAAPVSICWSMREEMDSLLIASATLSMWRLTERAHPPHKLLSKGVGAGGAAPGGAKTTDCFTSLSWQPTGAWPMEGGEPGAAVAGCRPLAGAPLAVLATPRALRLLAEPPRYLCSRTVPTGAEASPPAATPPKKTKYGPGAPPGGAGGARVASVAVSWAACAAVALDDRSQLHVYRLHPADLPGQAGQGALAALAARLERAAARGADGADVLLTLAPAALDALHDRMTESFQRQPQQFQQHYQLAWLRLRLRLCSMMPAAQASASNLTSLLACAATSAACAGGLRADDRPDGGPAALAALLDDHADHDKALPALEAKAEALGEAAPAALLPLQALRRPLQRALHAALTALAALAAQHASPSAPSAATHGYELWSDPAALTLLRKLLVVSRASARGAGGAGEAGAALQAVLARLAGAPHAVKPDLIEECLTLCAQQPARVWEARPRCGLLAPHSRPPPFYFEYGVEPEYLRYVPEPPPYAVSDLSPSYDMDAIRYMYLGGGAGGAGGRGRWRECGRCGARALPAAHCARHPLQRAHDARFAAACRCGGKWTLISNI